MTKKGEVIHVTATCDSLLRKVEYYEELYYRARDSLEQHREDVRIKTRQERMSSRDTIFILLVGSVCGAAVTAVLIIIKRKKQ